MKIISLFSLALAILCATQGSQAFSTATNGVDWNSVSTSPPATTDYTSLTVGQCMCDLTPNLCDPNCCCDTDCGTSATSFFTSCDRAFGGNNMKLTCAPETSSVTEILSSTQELLRKRYFGQDSVCVVDTNLADRSGIDPFYRLPTDAAKNALTAPGSSWPAPTYSGASSSGSSSSLSFHVGDLIPIVHIVPTGINSFVRSVPATRKYFPDLGANAAPAATCDSDAFLGFMKNGPATTTCQVSGTLATLCAAGGALNLDQFSYLAITRKDHDLTSKDVVVPVKLRVFDDTGFREELDPTNPVAIAFGGSATAPTAAVATSYAAPNCNNAVTSTRLTIEYAVNNGVTSITAATLVVRVKTLLTPTATNLYTRSSAVRFVLQGSAAASANNDVPIASETKRPGSPGYTAGRPVLAGYYTSQTDGKEAVLTSPNGFTVPMSGDCLSNPRFASVPFGHNVETAGCSLTLTEAQLQTYCNTGTGTVLKDTILKPASCGGAACPTNTTVFDRIGFDGEAASTDINDWVAVQNKDFADPKGLLYNTVFRQCSGLVTGLHWTFGVARAGPTFNPQDVIVTAKVDPIIGSWTFSGTGATTNVRFTFKTTFVRMPEGGEYIRKAVVPPSLFPAVDEDVFYPFRRPDA